MDIESNVENIVSDMEMKPFNDIMKRYNERLTYFDDFLNSFPDKLKMEQACIETSLLI